MQLIILLLSIAFIDALPMKLPLAVKLEAPISNFKLKGVTKLQTASKKSLGVKLKMKQSGNFAENVQVKVKSDDPSVFPLLKLPLNMQYEVLKNMPVQDLKNTMLANEGMMKLALGSKDPNIEEKLIEMVPSLAASNIQKEANLLNQILNRGKFKPTAMDLSRILKSSKEFANFEIMASYAVKNLDGMMNSARTQPEKKAIGSILFDLVSHSQNPKVLKAILNNPQNLYISWDIPNIALVYNPVFDFYREIMNRINKAVQSNDVKFKNREMALFDQVFVPGVMKQTIKYTLSMIFYDPGAFLMFFKYLQKAKAANLVDPAWVNSRWHIGETISRTEQFQIMQLIRSDEILFSKVRDPDAWNKALESFSFSHKQ